MAAAQILPLVEVALLHEANRLKRRQAVDSVLGTMGAEGELPSTKTLALMEEYVDGHITMTELVDTIFANARG
jgi:hypothetical protein